GLYPLVSWKINDKVTWAMEGSENSAGIAIDWMKNIDLIKNPSESGKPLNVKDSDGVFFVSSLCGLGSPYYDSYAKGVLIGITANTKKEHIIKSIIDSFGYRMNDIITTFKNELLSHDQKIKVIRVDGGVSVNDEICQSIANITNIN